MMDSHLCSQLDLNDLKHMRLTCKTLANDVASLVLSRISIPAKEATTIEEVVSDLQFLTKSETAAVNCTREITIDNFSSIFRDSSPENRESGGNGSVALDHVKRTSQDILAALTSFKIVQTVKYATIFVEDSSLLICSCSIYLVGTREEMTHFGFKRLSGMPSGYIPTFVI
jgi:hypothetical protein